MIIIVLDKFEIHYFLKPNSHSLDAIIQNRCEAEFLAIAYEIAKSLDLDITLNAEALREGGLKEVWEVIGKNSNQISVLLIALTAVFSYLAIPDTDLNELQKENLRLQNYQLKQEILSNDLKEKDVLIPLEAANRNSKIITRRSNFYKLLHSSPEVKKVGFTNFNSNNKTKKTELIIGRPSFIHFIQRSNKLPVEIDENALIEIVAPVLREGSAKWKGIYKDEQIGFHMMDHIYREAVLNKKISFIRGHSIKCILEIHRELNETGEIIIKKYSVKTVLETLQNDLSQETNSGKKHRKAKAIAGEQNDFFIQK